MFELLYLRTITVIKILESTRRSITTILFEMVLQAFKAPVTILNFKLRSNGKHDTTPFKQD